MSQVTGFGLIKDGWLRDSPEGVKIVLDAWGESEPDVKALTFYVSALERRIEALTWKQRELEKRLHKLE